MLLNWLYQQIIKMSKKSKKRKKKFWKSKLPKITISVEIVSNDGFKIEENDKETNT